jgi:SAM-dependent methyltransferase
MVIDASHRFMESPSRVSVAPDGTSHAMFGSNGAPKPTGGVSPHTVPMPDEIYFDESIAATYDEDSADMFDPAVLDPTVDFLADLAGDGRALELGIGTGRVAVPLSRRGVLVHGIELSPAMAKRLKAKLGGDDIGVTIGDFATAKADGTFRLAYLVYNTIENLTTQDEQVECFLNAAAHLEPGGCFVIEVGVPGLQRLPPGETVQPFLVSPTRLGFDEYDVVTQGLISHHYWVGDREVFSMPFRYVWPSELDLMARIAGMRLRERWGGWTREPFTSKSASHVSVWDKL